jgi:hypothetical protein
VATELIVDRPGPPPLRIHHLMACAVVTAVELSLLRLMLNRGPQQTAAGDGVFAFTQVLSAIGLTLTGFSIYWRSKGYASFSQPGQMLLLQYAVSFVLQLFSMVLVMAMIGNNASPSNVSGIRLLSTVLGVGSLLFGVILPMAFYAWCAWKVADTGPWRMLFVCCAVMSAMSQTFVVFAVQFVMRISPTNIPIVFAVPHLARGAVLLPMGAFVAMSDLARRTVRSWTHWAGLILWLMGLVGMLLTGPYHIFFWHIP